MELPSRFKRFLEQIRPSAAHINQLRRGHTNLRRLILRDHELRNHIVTTFLQGSYRRSTAIRAVDGRIGSDVDIVLVTNLDPQAHAPDAVLNRLKPILRPHYPDLRMQGRSLRVEADDVALDLVLGSWADGRKPRLDSHRVQGQDVLARVPTTDFAAFIKHVTAAAKLARRALDSEDDGESAALWRQLFGPAFPAASVDPPVADPPPATTPSWSVSELVQALNERRAVIAEGYDQLTRVKRAVEQAVQQLGIHVVIDKSTPPELRDFFGVMLLNSLQGGLTGAGVGLLASALFGRTRELMAVGAIVGGLLGASQGHARVKTGGWRLRSGYRDGGEVFVELRILS